MKTLKCDLCDATAKGNSFEEWMNNLMTHYMEAHPDFMKQSADAPAEEQETGKKKWMEENKARFDAQAEDVESIA